MPKRLACEFQKSSERVFGFRVHWSGLGILVYLLMVSLSELIRLMA